LVVGVGCRSARADVQLPSEGEPAPRATAALPAPAPKLDRDAVAKVFHEFLQRGCQRQTRQSLFEAWAPGGTATRMGAGGLPRPGEASYIENDLLVSLSTPQPAARVIWWNKPPREDAEVREIRLVPEQSARVVEYAWFVSRYGLAVGKPQPQTHPLSDIPHEHIMACGGTTPVTVTLNQIVWAEPFVGKIGEIAVRR
jgi:hypothetical protein